MQDVVADEEGTGASSSSARNDPSEQTEEKFSSLRWSEEENLHLCCLELVS